MFAFVGRSCRIYEKGNWCAYERNFVVTKMEKVSRSLSPLWNSDKTCVLDLPHMRLPKAFARFERLKKPSLLLWDSGIPEGPFLAGGWLCIGDPGFSEILVAS